MNNFFKRLQKLFSKTHLKIFLVRRLHKEIPVVFVFSFFLFLIMEFSRADVAKHNQYDDAWIIYDDGVYNISDWSYKHPGGRVILYYRGQDATEPVNAFHPDIEKTKRYMKPYKMGSLTTEEFKKISPVIADFRALRKEFENEGFYIQKQSLSSYLCKITNFNIYYLGKFKPQISFYLSYLIQIVFLELLAVATLYYTGSIILTALILATSQIQAGWQQHDFGHCAVFKSAKLNQLVHYLFIGVFKGALSWWWKSRHNRHHAKTNMIKLDPDMHVEPLFSFSDELATKPKWKPWKRFVPFLPYQKFYWFLFGPPVVTTLLFMYENTVFMAKRGISLDIIAVYLFFVRFDMVFTNFLPPLQVIALYFLMRFIESHWFTWVTSMNVSFRISFKILKSCSRFSLPF